jgi:hypothetical protein
MKLSQSIRFDINPEHFIEEMTYHALEYDLRPQHFDTPRQTVLG